MKLRMSSVSALAVAGVLLAGCAMKTGELPGIASSNSSGSAFDTFLKNEYIALSQREESEKDWGDADAFAERALAAFAGASPDPEAISARNLPADRVRILTGARKRLMAAFDAGGKDVSPAHAAGAQAAFDCWMQEQEENRQPAHIKECQDDFIFHMEILEEFLAPPAPKPEPVAAAPAPEPEPAPLPDLAGDVIVYFDLNSDVVNAAGMREVRRAVGLFGSSKADWVRLVGHTDTLGASAYNEALAKRRVAAVAAALQSAGLEGGAIGTASLGEDSPAVSTGDGVEEYRNRRVTISFQR